MISKGPRLRRGALTKKRRLPLAGFHPATPAASHFGGQPVVEDDQVGPGQRPGMGQFQDLAAVAAVRRSPPLPCVIAARTQSSRLVSGRGVYQRSVTCPRLDAAAEVATPVGHHAPDDRLADLYGSWIGGDKSSSCAES